MIHDQLNSNVYKARYTILFALNSRFKPRNTNIQLKQPASECSGKRTRDRLGGRT